MTNTNRAMKNNLNMQPKEVTADRREQLLCELKKMCDDSVISSVTHWQHCTDTGAVAIFGVFAAPILAQLARGNGDFPCFAACRWAEVTDHKFAMHLNY